MSEAILGDSFDASMRRLEAPRRWDLILRLARQRLATVPDCSVAHFWAGLAALRSGDLAAAEVHADEAQAREPEDRNSFQLRAELLFKQGRIEEARCCLEDALVRWPDNENFHQMLSAVHILRQDESAAASAAQHTLELNPGNLPARLVATLLKHHYLLCPHLAEQQIAELQSLLRDDPNHARVLQKLGEVCLFKLGSPERAIPFLEQSLASDPHHENTQQLYELARRLAETPAVTLVEASNLSAPASIAATCVDAVALPWQSESTTAFVAAAAPASGDALSTSVDVNSRPWNGEDFEDVLIS